MSDTLLDQLPVLRDTGKKFIPGVDVAYANYRGDVYKIDGGNRLDGKWRWLLGPHGLVCGVDLPAYSTMDAARQSRYSFGGQVSELVAALTSLEISETVPLANLKVPTVQDTGKPFDPTQELWVVFDTPAGRVGIHKVSKLGLSDSEYVVHANGVRLVNHPVFSSDGEAYRARGNARDSANRITFFGGTKPAIRTTGMPWKAWTIQDYKVLEVKSHKIRTRLPEPDVIYLLEDGREVPNLGILFEDKGSAQKHLDTLVQNALKNLQGWVRANRLHTKLPYVLVKGDGTIFPAKYCEEQDLWLIGNKNSVTEQGKVDFYHHRIEFSRAIKSGKLLVRNPAEVL